MGSASNASRRSRVWIALVVLATGVLAVLGVSAASAAGRGVVEMPAAVQTDGPTTDEILQQQVALTGALLRDLPADSQRQQVRIVIGQDELDAIDQADRAISPQKIGFVKPMAPTIELNGLELSPSPNSPHQGRTGRALRTPDGGFVWAAEITAEMAGAIRVHFENVDLPAGAELYVYSMSGESYGPFRQMGPDGTGEFWAPTVFGTEVLVQIQIPASAAGSLRGVSLRIGEVGLLTPKASGKLPPTEQAAICGNPSCVEDAMCHQAAANSIWNAYAKMEWVAGAFIYTCTGGLMNDSNPSSANYFLTANHCVSKNNNAKNVQFYWSFRTSSCNGTCPNNNGWPLKSAGSSVAATNRKGDFTLLSLTGAPPAGATRLGFTNAPVANSNGTPLHRVSNPNFGPQVYSEQTVDTSAGTCSGWPRGERIYSRDTLGATDGGSSGSPIVNASNQVVGQLSGACGFDPGDPCNSEDNATVDGALAFYWNTVQPFLAP